MKTVIKALTGSALTVALAVGGVVVLKGNDAAAAANASGGTSKVGYVCNGGPSGPVTYNRREADAFCAAGSGTCTFRDKPYC